MNNRYPYLRANVLRKIRDLNQIVEGCDNILKRMESPIMTDTYRGKRNPDWNEEEKVARLRKRVKDAIIHLKVGTE
jgi:hypothetical protein